MKDKSILNIPYGPYTQANHFEVIFRPRPGRESEQDTKNNQSLDANFTQNKRLNKYFVRYENNELDMGDWVTM